MQSIKDIYNKLNPRVAMVGTALVITTSIGTCQLSKPAEEPTVEEAPLVVPVEEPVVEEPVEEPAIPSEEGRAAE